MSKAAGIPLWLLSVCLMIGTYSKAQQHRLECGADQVFSVLYAGAGDYDPDSLMTAFDNSQDDRKIEINSRSSDFNIPVVVHIVSHADDRYISDQTVIEQIAVLNNDFNGGNFDLSQVPLEFQPFIGKTGIHFCMADLSHEGLSSSGIIRKQTDRDEIGFSQTLFYDSLGGSSAYDPLHYINIWVANTGNAITGFGTYPGIYPTENQGVVIHPDFFGLNP